jgi:hypothetical protein
LAKRAVIARQILATAAFGSIERYRFHLEKFVLTNQASVSGFSYLFAGKLNRQSSLLETAFEG